MADSDSNWSDRDKPKDRGKGKSGGPPTWLRVLSPLVGALSSGGMRKGGKVRKPKARARGRH